MLELIVNTDNKKVAKLLEKLPAALRDDAPIIIAQIGKELTQRHITSVARNRHRAGQSQNFYQDAADSVVAEVVRDGAEISIPKVGFALRYHGGTVRPSGRVSLITGRPIKRLALPIRGSEAEGKTPGEFRNVFVVKGRKPGTAYLAAKKGNGMIGILFALLAKTEHKQDHSILPTDAEYQDDTEKALNVLIDEVTK